MVRVKICGITRLEDARAAVDAGAGALGFNFWRPGRRYILPELAAGIIAALPEDVWKVGVFVDEPPELVLETARVAGLTALQLHGAETPEHLAALGTFRKVKAFRMDNGFNPAVLAAYAADAFLLDGVGSTPGGTGAVFDWQRALEVKRWGRVILAGGLTPENAGEAVRRVQPWAVDVAGGVEIEPGKKDPRLVERFIRAVREAEKS